MSAAPAFTTAVSAAGSHPPSPPSQGVFDGFGRLFDFRSGFKLSSALYAGKRRFWMG